MSKRMALYLSAVLLMAGCAGPAHPATGNPPENPSVGHAAASQPAADLPATSPSPLAGPPIGTNAAPDLQPLTPWPPTFVAEPVPGGFRMGPFRQSYPARWIDNQQLYLSLQHERGAILALLDAAGGPLHVLSSHENGVYYMNEPVMSGQAVLFSYGTSGDPGGLWLQSQGTPPRQVAGIRTIPHVGPDGMVAVAYGRGGRGQFIDLRTGESRELETPDLYAAPRLDAWSPTVDRYVTQSPRTDAIPGFRFFDSAGRLTGSFHEPGYYSSYPTWSPNGRYLGFLSMPLDQTYSTHPEAVFEPDIAPRVGVLDVALGKARYFALPGLVTGGHLLWSPDGSRLAVTVGLLHPAGSTWEGTSVTAQQVAVADLASGHMQVLTEPAGPEATIWPQGFSPDGTALAVRTHANAASNPSYALLSVKAPDRPAVPLPGEPLWLSDEQLVVVAHQPDRLLLVDSTGTVLKQLAQGRSVSYPTRSPDGQYLAYVVDTLSKEVQHASDPAATYVYIIELERVK